MIVSSSSLSMKTKKQKWLEKTEALTQHSVMYQSSITSELLKTEDVRM